MSERQQPSVPILVVALLWSTAALIFVARDTTALAVAAAVCSAMAMAVEFARMCIPPSDTDPATLVRYVEQARAGRKLAIYDRDTGLFAHWYMSLRAQEECARAARYKRGLSLFIIEPRRSNAADEWSVKGNIDRWIQTELRATDIAGYLGNGRYLILAPEADLNAGARLAERLREDIDQVDIGFSSFPHDGSAFQELWQSATKRINDQHASAA